MSKLNDALESEWDSAAWKASYQLHQKELTFGEHIEAKAMDRQVGGSHYKNMAIQPASFNHKNGIGYLLGTAIAYLAREGHKDIPLSDVRKAKHTLELYIQLEEEKT